MCRTAANVTSDTTAAVVIAKSEGETDVLVSVRLEKAAPETS
jgi:Na+/H+-dicarboxylate symporter